MPSHPAQSPSNSRKYSSAFRNVLQVALWLSSIGVLSLHPLKWLTGDSLKPVRIVSYITPWLLILLLPMLILVVLARRKWLSFALAASVMVIILPTAPLFLPNRQAQSQDEFSVKIMSYNLHGIPEIGGIIEVIRREKPDVLLIQECSPALCSPFFHGLDDLYPYKDMVIKDFGQAAFSRYPLIRTSAEFDQGRTQKLIIKAPAGMAAIWNVHPIPPFLIPPEQFDAQISSLAADIAQVEGPLIVAGDLNATDQSEVYRSITRHLTDAYREAGWGFGFSYPAPPYTFMDSGIQVGPIWRIDHIFHSQEFIAARAYILESAGGSDHFPLVAEFLIRK